MATNNLTLLLNNKISKDIYTKIITKNKNYVDKHFDSLPEQFWKELSKNPDKLEELLRTNIYQPIFVGYIDEKAALDTLEKLSNFQLLNLRGWMLSRLEKSMAREALIKEREPGKKLADLIDKKYNNKDGIKAGQMKQIARILRNQNTEYDPEYVNSTREATA